MGEIGKRDRAGNDVLAIGNRRLHAAVDPSCAGAGGIDAFEDPPRDPRWLLEKDAASFLDLGDKDRAFRRRILSWACDQGLAPALRAKPPKGKWEDDLPPEVVEAWALEAGYDGYVIGRDDMGEPVSFRILAERLPEWKVTPQPSSRHEVALRGFHSLDEAAAAVGDLRYDALARFLRALEAKLVSDARMDRERGRRELAGRLHSAGLDVGDAAEGIERAWEICGPRMGA